MKTTKTIVMAASLALMPLIAGAQKPVTQTDTAEVTTTIVAIDHTMRTVSLKTKDGALTTMTAPPEVKRFDELKVGDTVTFKYYESRAYQIRKPGQAAPAPAGGAAVTRGTGARPGATIAQQKSATVTVKAVDTKVPSITVLTSDARTVTFKVDDPKSLEGVKAGDKIDITYTEAVVISVQ